MTSEKRQFEATEGLLNDVMRKQAGSIEKAILEAVMNSVDANATEIEIQLEDDRLIVKDDGDGMERSDVEEYFQKFGLKDDDIEGKDFGKFRMGRGQIFSFGQNVWLSQQNVMVVDLDNDKTTVEIEGAEETLDSAGLSYNLIEKDDFTEGCEIRVDLYSSLGNRKETVEETKRLIRYIPWLHDVAITINGEDIYNELEYEAETEHAYYFFDGNSWGRYMDVYNQGAYVKGEKITSTPGIVVTKNDLDVNFARNDILDTCDEWQEVVKECIEETKRHLLERDSYKTKEKRWLLEEAADDDWLRKEILNIPLVEDVTGESWSIHKLQGEKISFGRHGDRIAEDTMKESGVIILDNNFKGLLEDVVHGSTFMDYKNIIEDEMKFEMSEVDDKDLSKKRSQRLEIIRWVLKQVGHTGTVKAGWSKNSNIWMDDEGVLYVHKNYLKTTKDEFQTEVLFEAIKTAALDRDTRGGVDYDYSFESKFWKYMKDYPVVQNAVINNNTGVDNR